MSLNNNTNWTLSEDLSGPAIAAFVGLEFVFSFSINLFIVTHTLHSLTNRRRRERNQKRSSSYFSSTVFLLNITVANLLMTVLFMLPYVIAAAAGGWIYGSTDSQREATCITAAFVFSYTVSLSLTTLAAISFDRFLSIVKSDFHRRKMRPKLVMAIVVIMWIYALILAVPIFIGNTGGNKNYAYSDSTGMCLPWLVGKQSYAIFFSIATLLPIGIIVVTTIWTFVFTRKFLQKDYRRRRDTLQRKDDKKVERSVYLVRIRNLIGVFGSLLLSNIIALLPYYVTTMVAFGVTIEKIPAAVYTASLLLFLLSNVTNSLIQAYFRRDLHKAIVHYLYHFWCSKGKFPESSFVESTIHAQSSVHVVTTGTGTAIGGTGGGAGGGGVVLAAGMNGTESGNKLVENCDDDNDVDDPDDVFYTVSRDTAAQTHYKEEAAKPNHHMNETGTDGVDLKSGSVAHHSELDPESSHTVEKHLQPKTRGHDSYNVTGQCLSASCPVTTTKTSPSGLTGDGRQREKLENTSDVILNLDAEQNYSCSLPDENLEHMRC